MDNPIVALTVTTIEAEYLWLLEDYPNLSLSHNYCVNELSDIDPFTVISTGWIYADGDIVDVPGRWNIKPYLIQI